jgi:hypothetical protein
MLAPVDASSVGPDTGAGAAVGPGSGCPSIDEVVTIVVGLPTAVEGGSAVDGGAHAVFGPTQPGGVDPGGSPVGVEGGAVVIVGCVVVGAARVVDDCSVVGGSDVEVVVGASVEVVDCGSVVEVVEAATVVEVVDGGSVEDVVEGDSLVVGCVVGEMLVVVVDGESLAPSPAQTPLRTNCEGVAPVKTAYEPLVSRPVTVWPVGTGTNTLSVCEEFEMIGGNPVNVNVTPSTSRTTLTKAEPPLLGVSTKCQYALVPGQPLAGPAVALCKIRLLAGNVASVADAAWDCMAAIDPTAAPPKTNVKPIRLRPPRTRCRHGGRAMRRARPLISRSVPSVDWSAWGPAPPHGLAPCGLIPR